MEPQEQPTSDELKHLKEKNSSLNLEIQSYTSTIASLRSHIATLESSRPSDKSLQTFSPSEVQPLLNFKIVIGNEDSARALELLESSESKCKSLSIKLDSLQSSLLKLKEEKHILQDSLNFEKMTQENLLKKLQKSQEDLIQKETILSSLQENHLKLKKSQKNHIERNYQLLKKNSLALGIQIRQSNVIDTLGVEDLDEFLQIQTDKILEIVGKVNNELSGKFGIQTIRSLDEVKSAIIIVVDESNKKVQEYKEIALTSEKIMQNSQKENLELMKKFKELQVSHENLKKNFAGLQEESFNNQEKLTEMERIQTENEQIKNVCKKIAEDAKEKQSKFDDEMKKFEKTYKYVNEIEEQLAELKVSLRTCNNNLEEKEKSFNELKKEKDFIQNQLQDLKSFSNTELSTSKHYYESIIKKVSEENVLEKKTLTEKFTFQVQNLENQIFLLQKDSDELALAKSKLIEHDNRVLYFHKLLNELQDRVQTLNNKNDEILEEKEKILQESLEKDKKFLDFSEKMKKNEEELKNSIKDLKTRCQETDLKYQQAENMKEEANQLLIKVQEKIENQDNWIDRRMVVTFLVNFLNENNTEKMKFQMLKPFAEMLGLDREQRVKIGLEQEPGLLAQFTTFLTRG
jgi:chromosome segregation ATPase